MNGLTIFAITFGLGVAMSVAGWRLHLRAERRALVEAATARVHEATRQATLTVGRALMPVMRDIAVSMAEMADAMAKTAAVMETTPEDVDRLGRLLRETGKEMNPWRSNLPR